MATLTRPRLSTRPASSPSHDLTSAIPTPFPRDLLVRELNPTESTGPGPLDEQQSQPLTQVGQTNQVQEEEAHGLTARHALHEVMPSIAYVKKSCLMTLNNLLSVAAKWSPIVPDRRHSMPSSISSPNASQAEADSSSIALRTLLANLRCREASGVMLEFHEPRDEAELLHELRTRIDSISSTLDPADAELATSLASLLSNLHRLSHLQAGPSHPLSPSTSRIGWSKSESSTPGNHFDMLKQQLNDFQLERISFQHVLLGSGASPVLVVEAALLWAKIDGELETVMAMCKERTEGLPRPSIDALPPQYDPEDYHTEELPEYEAGGRVSLDGSKSRSENTLSPSSTRQMDEKMRLDLENVTMAIDRLYLVAPQLHNQRVELKSAKLAQMEKAEKEGPLSLRAGKGKERDVRELENILDLLNKASERSLKDQAVVLEGGFPGLLEKTRQKDIAKREAFVEQLAQHSQSGRLHDQDAVLHPRSKDPHTLLTFPEFIREPVPSRDILLHYSQRMENSTRETASSHTEQPEDGLSDGPAGKEKKSLRNRSLSASSLSWFRPSSRSGSSSNSGSEPSSQSGSRSRAINVIPSVPTVAFDISYVAEHHGSLQHVLVFFTATGATQGLDMEAEVVPPLSEGHPQGSDRLIIRNGSPNSLELTLPACVPYGRQEVRAQSGYHEIKLATIGSPSSASTDDHSALLDASQLSAMKPTAFTCASCSLPVVQASKIHDYRDLPSEHWEELVDAWMCHSDQKLHAQVLERSQRGFWPSAGQALVGGSYILFEEGSMTKHNIHISQDSKSGGDWCLVRCLCGAIIGRCQDHRKEEGNREMAYRLFKFSIRPVSPTTEPSRIPLSAFIVEDMIEFTQAHATYRFVVMDEEDEIPRILIWLFKPSLRLAYATPRPYALPKAASIRAAKVLYKVLTPSERSADLKTILDRYPGFPQAEYLYYPLSVCRRLAGLLRESNSAYPESMRTMTGLQVGWLQRS